VPQCALATTFVYALGRSVEQSGRAGEPASAGQLIGLAQRIGATALHLSAGPIAQFLPALLAELMTRRAELPVLSVDATLGAIRLGRPRAALASAASLDRQEAHAAVEVAIAALALASEVGAPYITLRLGPVAGLGRLWEPLKTHFLRGALAEDEAPADELLTARSALAGRHLEATLRSLDRLVTAAQRLDLAVLLPNPRRAVELPAPIELRALRSEFRGAPLFPQLDVPAAHLASAMRLFSLRDSVLAFADGPLANLSDACGAVGGLPPGHGEADLPAIARTLAPGTHREFVPWPALRLAEVIAGYRAVAAL
jgi:hypothetical protein